MDANLNEKGEGKFIFRKSLYKNCLDLGSEVV